MAGVAIDHIVSIIIFLAAILLFVGLFSQTAQTAVIYQQHQGVATKCSDLLDNMLLSPGSPSYWGQSNSTLASFGVQDPEFTQYELSSFSLMRLQAAGDLVEYDKTPNTFYTQISSNGAFLVTPNSYALNYSEALKLLGINGTYGFQLSLTPDATLSIRNLTECSPLELSVTATGASFPFAGATVNYCLILVELGQTDAQYPSCTMLNGTATTNQQGVAVQNGHPYISFPTVTDSNQIYAFIAYAHLDGVVGVGYYTSVTENSQSVVPVLQDMGSQTVVLAHNYDLNNSDAPTSSLKYNATFVIATQDYTLSELSLDSTHPNYGVIMSGKENPTQNITLPTCTTGILIVTYQESSGQGGVVLMPWGVSSLAFPVSFGGDPSQQEWVATDLRQVMIGDVSYQAKLSLWSDTHMQVTS